MISVQFIIVSQFDNHFLRLFFSATSISVIYENSLNEV